MNSNSLDQLSHQLCHSYPLAVDLRRGLWGVSEEVTKLELWDIVCAVVKGTLQHGISLPFPAP